MNAGVAGGVHEWTYWFDPDDGRLRAYHIVYGPDDGDATYGEYADYRQVGPWRMATRRVSYESNHAAERLRPSSQVVYEDIRLDESFPDDLFELPPPG